MDITVQANGYTILQEMEMLGRAGGEGADSIVKAATLAGSFAADKRAQPGEAQALYMAYYNGYNDEVIAADELNADSLKTQVSQFRSFMLPEVAKHGAVLWERALKVHLKLAKDCRVAKSNYAALIVANRAQKASKDCLTVPELEEALTKAEPKEKELAKELAKLAKAAAKIEKDFGVRMGEVEKQIELVGDKAKRDEIARAKAKAEGKVEGWDEVSGETDETIIDAEFEVIPENNRLAPPNASLN